MSTTQGLRSSPWHLSLFRLRSEAVVAATLQSSNVSPKRTTCSAFLRSCSHGLRFPARLMVVRDPHHSSSKGNRTFLKSHSCRRSAGSRSRTQSRSTSLKALSAKRETRSPGRRLTSKLCSFKTRTQVRQRSLSTGILRSTVSKYNVRTSSMTDSTSNRRSTGAARQAEAKAIHLSSTTSSQTPSKSETAVSLWRSQAMKKSDRLY